MPRVSGPLFALTATGKPHSGPAYRRGRSSSVAYDHHAPSEPATLNQVYRRAQYSMACKLWRNPDSLWRAYWDFVPQQYRQRPWPYFITNAAGVFSDFPASANLTHLPPSPRVPGPFPQNAFPFGLNGIAYLGVFPPLPGYTFAGRICIAYSIQTIARGFDPPLFSSFAIGTGGFVLQIDDTKFPYRCIQLPYYIASSPPQPPLWQYLFGWPMNRVV